MKPCKVCSSPNRVFFEEQRAKGRICVALSGMAKRTFGEKIRAREFLKHFEDGHGIEEFGREVIT